MHTSQGADLHTVIYEEAVDQVMRAPVGREERVSPR
jgi:hypothetical protein